MHKDTSSTAGRTCCGALPKQFTNLSTCASPFYKLGFGVKDENQGGFCIIIAFCQGRVAMNGCLDIEANRMSSTCTPYLQKLLRKSGRERL
jgi:hypothetical protein